MIEVVGEGAKYWPRWRGPSGRVRCAAGQYVDTWTAKTGVWKTAVPGRGNSSPIVWGDRIFPDHRLRQRRAAVDARVFARRRKEAVGDVHPAERRRVRPLQERLRVGDADDGRQLVYASFGRHGLFAFDFNGKLVWQHKFGIIDNYHGPAGSPVLYKDRIFIFQDANPAPNQPAFRRRVRQDDGKQIWLTPRAKPLVGHGGGDQYRRARRARRQQSVSRRAYDPDSGKELWTVRGNYL
jgi:outer membrane protein assembly factor BamB